MSKLNAYFAGLVVLIVLIVSSALATNHLSCTRSNRVRSSQLGEEQYAVDAAAARAQSARNEASSNPEQSRIDATAARRFRVDAAHIHIKLLHCGLAPTE